MKLKNMSRDEMIEQIVEQDVEQYLEDPEALADLVRSSYINMPDDELQAEWDDRNS